MQKYMCLLMLLGGESIYDASLAASAFVHGRPADITEMCSNSAQVFMAISSLMYQPSVLKQVRNSHVEFILKIGPICLVY